MEWIWPRSRHHRRLARSFGQTGLRSHFPIESRCIYFTISDEAITVVLRIMHGRQNISPDDFPESDL
ncbi:MAG: hypothetical protein U5N27_01815 [Rhizobium sp.]|nr:hypothetical protein [Rhizobium sp.]